MEFVHTRWGKLEITGTVLPAVDIKIGLDSFLAYPSIFLFRFSLIKHSLHGTHTKPHHKYAHYSTTKIFHYRYRSDYL